MKSGSSLIGFGGDDSGGAAGGSIGIDMTAVGNGDWGNILKIDMKRIFPFPDFLMQWVTRQIEEFSNKLTDLPTLYIILPDFSALLGTTKTVNENLQKARNAFSDDASKKRDETNKNNPTPGASYLW